MSARAVWHLADFLDAVDDPFDTMIYSSGLTVDLTGPEEQLHQALTETLSREARLFDGGLTCDLKEDGQDCQTCPLPVMNTADPLSRLCRLGKDQFNILGRLGERKIEREAPFVELARSIEPFAEIGHLDEAEAERLTAAGL